MSGGSNFHSAWTRWQEHIGKCLSENQECHIEHIGPNVTNTEVVLIMALVQGDMPLGPSNTKTGLVLRSEYRTSIIAQLFNDSILHCIKYIDFWCVNCRVTDR